MKTRLTRIISMLSILFVLCLLVIWQESDRRYVHISVDDATQILKEVKERNYNSIFEQKTISKMREWHLQYGFKCTLYIYEEFDGFHIGDMPVKFRKEFEENSDWLKIGYHAASDRNPQGNQQGLEDFITSYELTTEAILTFAGEKSQAKLLRLHYWYATSEMMNYLHKQKIVGVLCPDDGKAGYDLSDAENKSLQNSRSGHIRLRNMMYYITDIRYEKEEDIVRKLENRKQDYFIVLFTHAWCIEEYYDRIEMSLEWLQENEYQFVIR